MRAKFSVDVLFLFVINIFPKVLSVDIWSPHSFFVDSKETARGKFYTHTFLIDRPASIPCFFKNDTPTLGVNHTDVYTFIYSWNFQSFKLTPSSLFVTAIWDINGELFITRIMQRRITLWCPATTACHEINETKSWNFAHRIQFVDAPLI